LQNPEPSPVVVEFSARDWKALVSFLEVKLTVAHIERNRVRGTKCFKGEEQTACRNLALVERLLAAVKKVNP
jgi:hypothetical protein